MTIDIDKETLNEYKKFINSPKFANFLLENTTNFSVAALVLQTLLDEHKRIAAILEEQED